MRKHFGEWLKAKIEERNMTITELAERAGYDQSTVSHWIAGRRRPSQKALTRICEALGVSIREAMLALGTLPSDVFEVSPNIVRIPLLCGSVPCGTPKEQFDEYIMGETYLPEDVVKTRLGESYKHGLKLFCVRAMGNSMKEKGIVDGTYVIFSPDLEVNNGDIAVVNLNGALTIKQVFFHHDHIVLHSANPDFRPLVVNKTDDFCLVGKVVMYIGFVGFTPLRMLDQY